MADNVTITTNCTQPDFTVATDDVGGVHYPIYKQAFGSEDSATLVDSATPLPIGFPTDGPNFDAFNRLRVSNPQTIFDSKQLFDNQPLFWDDQEVSGTATTSSHSANTASTTLGVASTTAGKRVRQTFMRFNYQPGKSQLILLTGVLNSSGGGTGIVSGMGLYDDNNGVFLKYDEGTVKIVLRSNVTGSAVDTEIVQSSWNKDKMDGTGASGYTLDWTKSLIFVIDFEWLGVGRVRTGFVMDGIIHYAHEFLNTNNTGVVYMSTPNLPLRYEIENTGSGVASTLSHICSTVMSEGGTQNNGSLRYKSTGGTHINANTADTLYGAIGVRLKSGYVGADVICERLSVITTTSDDFEWTLIFNPTVAGSPSWTNETNSAVQTVVGSTATTITGGIQVDGGLVKAGVGGGGAAVIATNAKKLGAFIDGSVEELWLCIRPLAINADIEVSLTWRELS